MNSIHPAPEIFDFAFVRSAAKDRYDPTNLFRLNQKLRPAAA